MQACQDSKSALKTYLVSAKPLPVQTLQVGYTLNPVLTYALELWFDTSQDSVTPTHLAGFNCIHTVRSRAVEHIYLVLHIYLH
jgi:hypothetical protein